MIVLATIITLFVLGSVIGWVIEVFFRRFFSIKKWINPGFLIGPYLPIYGIGVVFLYLLSNIDLSFLNIDLIWINIIRILTIGILMVIIEFIAGLIFIKGMNIKLWDYNKRKGNILGIICPLFSLIWLIVACLYYFLINPFLVDFISLLVETSNQIYFLFFGIIIGIIICDFCYSIHIATKIRKIAKEKKVVIYYAKLKALISSKHTHANKKHFFLTIVKNKDNIYDDINSYTDIKD